MKTKLYDITKLQIPSNYAKQKGVSKQRVYLMMKEGKLDYIEIDGTKFIIKSELNSNYKIIKPKKIIVL